MKDIEDAAERRAIEAIARRYARQGYRVSAAAEAAALPSFLGSYRPDLIAERADDRVIIEVKSSDRVRGANDIPELAERVADAAGWRFELIVLRRTDAVLKDLRSQAWRYVELGLSGPAAIVAAHAVEEAMELLASRSDRHARGKSSDRIARDLLEKGAISRDAFQAIRAVFQARQAALTGNGSASADEVARALRLSEDLLTEGVMAAAE